MDSLTQGIIAQLKGNPTRERFRVATIFVDHTTDYTLVYLQKYNDAEETLRAKHEYERISRSYGVMIQQYHADIGRFVDNKWWNDTIRQGQRMTLCGVNAHHQNGKVERRIKELSNLARSSLLQASS
jgi:hypothetical protein